MIILMKKMFLCLFIFLNEEAKSYQKLAAFCNCFVLTQHNSLCHFSLCVCVRAIFCTVLNVGGFPCVNCVRLDTEYCPSRHHGNQATCW